MAKATAASLLIRDEKYAVEFEEYIAKYLNLTKEQLEKSTYPKIIKCVTEFYRAETGKLESYLSTRSAKCAAWYIISSNDECMAKLAEAMLVYMEHLEDFEEEIVGLAIREVAKERVN